MPKTKVEISRWKCECQKCGHSWTTRTEDIPIQCPRCNSRNWE